MERKGFYIALEGIEGCGKTTQAERLINNLRRKLGSREVVLTREPGGCAVAEAMRKVLELTMGPVTEAYSFATARAQSLEEVVRPALKRGAVVVSDRSVYSSLAYQGGGRELGREKIWKINEEAVGETLPNQVVLIDIPVEAGLARKRGDDSKGKIIRLDELKVEFYERTRAEYLEMANEDPERWMVVDGEPGVEEVAEEILSQVLPRIPEV